MKRLIIIIAFVFVGKTAIPQTPAFTVVDFVNYIVNSATSISTEISKFQSSIQTTQYLNQFTEGVRNLEIIEQILQQLDAMVCIQKQLSLNISMLGADLSCVATVNISALALKMNAARKLIGYLYGLNTVGGVISKLSSSQAQGVTEDAKVSALQRILDAVEQTNREMQALNYTIDNAIFRRYQKQAKRKQLRSQVVLESDFARLSM